MKIYSQMFFLVSPLEIDARINIIMPTKTILEKYDDKMRFGTRNKCHFDVQRLHSPCLNT